MPSSARPAFTLIELLVTISIIAVLISLLLPAVQAARESARNSACINNLKQISLATLNFHDTYNLFPPARVAPYPSPSEPSNRRCGQNHTTWLVGILPFLEQQAVYDQFVLQAPFSLQTDSCRRLTLPVYSCPSRRHPQDGLMTQTAASSVTMPTGCVFTRTAGVGGSVTDYAGNHGDISPGATGSLNDFYHAGRGTGVLITSRPICDTVNTPTGPIPNLVVDWYDKIRLRDVVDGLSNTILVGERHVHKSRLLISPNDEPMFDGTNFYSMSRVAGPGMRLAKSSSDEVEGMAIMAFGSWHTQRVNFAFTDGRVQSLSTSASENVLGNLMHRNDGQVAGNF